MKFRFLKSLPICLQIHILNKLVDRDEPISNCNKHLKKTLIKLSLINSDYLKSEVIEEGLIVEFINDGVEVFEADKAKFETTYN